MVLVLQMATKFELPSPSAVLPWNEKFFSTLLDPNRVPNTTRLSWLEGDRDIKSILLILVKSLWRDVQNLDRPVPGYKCIELSITSLHDACAGGLISNYFYGAARRFKDMLESQLATQQLLTPLNLRVSSHANSYVDITYCLSAVCNTTSQSIAEYLITFSESRSSNERAYETYLNYGWLDIPRFSSREI